MLLSSADIDRTTKIKAHINSCSLVCITSKFVRVHSLAVPVTGGLV